jgi:carbon starvation protein
VALIALATIMMVGKQVGKPGDTYGYGIGRFLTVLIGQEHLPAAIVFGTMAFSTFVFDTLDVATRLGRYILQELFDWRTRAAGALATLATVGVPLFFILSAEAPRPGKPPAYMAFWTLFGTSNQLLAGLTLLGITVWLKRQGRPFWFTLAPMVFVLGITLWALAIQAGRAFRDAGSGLSPTTVNGAVCLLLMALTGLLAFEALRAVAKPPAEAAA